MNIFALFSQKQIQEFKEAFGIMDVDKDGIVSASDLKAAFTAVGKSISDSDASNMLSEAPGPVNFTQLVTLFAEKMAGGIFVSLRLHLRISFPVGQKVPSSYLLNNNKKLESTCCPTGLSDLLYPCIP